METGGWWRDVTWIPYQSQKTERNGRRRVSRGKPAKSKRSLWHPWMVAIRESEQQNRESEWQHNGWEPDDKTTLLCNVEEQKWRVWLATQFRKWGTNYEYICTRMQHLIWTRPNKHEDEPKPQGCKCKKVNTNGHLKENTVRDKTTQTCYATRQPSGVRMWHTTMQMRGLCSNTVHSHQGEEKLCLRSRQPTRELVREERKRISEMERLESKFDRSDQAFKTQVKPPWKLKLHTTRTTK